MLEQTLAPYCRARHPRVTPLKPRAATVETRGTWGAALGGRHERLEGHEEMGSSSPDGISACQIYQQLAIVDQRFQWPARKNEKSTLFSDHNGSLLRRQPRVVA